MPEDQNVFIDLDQDENFRIPITEAEFDDLVKELVRRYVLPNAEHAAAVIANQIQRLPPDQATTTLKYLGHCVLKNIAYQVAQNKSRKIAHKVQVDEIAAALKANPHDQQALDALQKASEEGSEYAKEVLSEYRPVDAGENVIPIISPPPLEPAG